MNIYLSKVKETKFEIITKVENNKKNIENCIINLIYCLKRKRKEEENVRILNVIFDIY